MEIDPRGRQLLSEPNIGNLGFHGLDGYPRVLPIWFRLTEAELLIASPPDAYKCRALRADGRAALTVSTPKAPYHFVSATGRVQVEVIAEEERIAFVRQVATAYLGAEGGKQYVDKWIRGGHPGPGDLLRLRIERVHYTNVSGE